VNSIAVCIPSIPSRCADRERCLHTVFNQTLQPEEVIVVLDAQAAGAAATRNRAWRQASAEWIAFVDDDDWLLPQHLERLLECARVTGADLVYPWFEIDGADELHVPERYGVPFDAAALRVANYIPVTVLARRRALEAVGGFPEPNSPAWSLPDSEDWGCWLALEAAGFTFAHLAERTWVWHRHASTRGKSWEADEAAASRKFADLERRFQQLVLERNGLLSMFTQARAHLERLEGVRVAVDLENCRMQVDLDTAPGPGAAARASRIAAPRTTTELGQRPRSPLPQRVFAALARLVRPER